MIARDRSALAPPPPLIDAEGRGEKERLAVRDWIDGGRKGKRPNFTAYKADGIAEALERLFEGKCAYCETRYVATQPIDVEHWRPKADVELDAGRKLGRGYEWLAAEWSNLLPSCIDCNRAREQLVLAAGDASQARRVLSGKANQFPLADEQRRLQHWRDDPAVEGALLLDPCAPGFDGADYFRFDDLGAIVPRDGPRVRSAAAKERRRRALESIRVYALNRSELVALRRERIVWIDARCAVVRRLLAVERELRAEAAHAGSARLAAAAAELARLAAEEIARLRELALPAQPWSLLARLRIAAFLRALARG